jgi:DNA modification methylase
LNSRDDFRIILGDAKDKLSELEDNEVQLFVSSPPYNIGKSYEKGTFGSLQEYRHWMESVVSLLWDKTADLGSVCWQVGNHVDRGNITPLDYVFFDLFTARGFKLRNRIIWTFNFGLNAKNRFSGRYETLLWFTKSDEYLFNLDPVRVPQLYPGKRHASKKEKAGQPSGNPLGKNPSDVWEFSAEGTFADQLVWRIPNVKAGHPEKTDHPCQFPSELVQRCVLAFTNEGHLVVDPFAGTGIVPITARALRRRGLGIEVSDSYVSLALQRAEALERGELALRRADQPVRIPRPTEKVAQLPSEWLPIAAE